MSPPRSTVKQLSTTGFAKSPTAFFPAAKQDQLAEVEGLISWQDYISITIFLISLPFIYANLNHSFLSSGPLERGCVSVFFSMMLAFGTTMLLEDANLGFGEQDKAEDLPKPGR